MPDGLLPIAHPLTPTGATARELQTIAALHRRATITDDAASRPAMMAGLELIVGLIGERGKRRSFADQWDHNYLSAKLNLPYRAGSVLTSLFLLGDRPVKKYKVTRTADERQALHDLISTGKAAARKLVHARIPLKADASDDGPHRPDGASPTPLRSASKRSGGSANASSKMASTPPWDAENASPRLGPSNSMAGARPDSSPWPARRRRRAEPAGP